MNQIHHVPHFISMRFPNGLDARTLLLVISSDMAICNLACLDCFGRIPRFGPSRASFVERARIQKPRAQQRGKGKKRSNKTEK
jgi:hypothetical protein